MLPEQLNPTMTTGINHVATLTGDLDRLKRFYEDVLGARTLFDLEDNGFRHAMVMVGPESGVHMFQHPTAYAARRTAADVRAWTLDHVANTAANADTFGVIRTRAIALGCDCDVVDYGPIVALNVEDPDGGQIEICCIKPGVDMTTPPLTQPLQQRGSARWASSARRSGGACADRESRRGTTAVRRSTSTRATRCHRRR